jgi:hypothetical protein
MRSRLMVGIHLIVDEERTLEQNRGTARSVSQAHGIRIDANGQDTGRLWPNAETGRLWLAA